MQKRIYQIRTQCQSSSQRDISMVYDTDILQKTWLYELQSIIKGINREIKADF